MIREDDEDEGGSGGRKLANLFRPPAEDSPFNTAKQELEAHIEHREGRDSEKAAKDAQSPDKVQSEVLNTTDIKDPNILHSYDPESTTSLESTPTGTEESASSSKEDSRTEKRHEQRSDRYAFLAPRTNENFAATPAGISATEIMSRTMFGGSEHANNVGAVKQQEIAGRAYNPYDTEMASNPNQQTQQSNNEIRHAGDNLADNKHQGLTIRPL